MDIARKVEIVGTAVASIASHSDADSVVILTALEAVAEIVTDAKAAVAAKNAAEAAAVIASKPVS